MILKVMILKVIISKFFSKYDLSTTSYKSQTLN